MSKILITGAAGFVGYHLANHLSKNSENQLVLADNLRRGRIDTLFKELIERPNVQFQQVNLMNLEEMKEKVWQYYDHVYHLAAIIGVKHCMNNPALVLDVNIITTMNVIKLVKENRCKRILFSSSCETYASSFDLGIVQVPTNEKVPLSIKDIYNPRMSYASSKLVGEQLVIFNSKDNYEYVIVRYHNIYGPRMGYAHFLPEVVKRIVNKEDPFLVYGYNQTRAFCYISDAIKQTVLAMSSDKTKNEILHVGNSSEESKILRGVKILLDGLDHHPELKLVEPPLGSVDRRCPNTTKIKELTGFHPEVSLEEGFQKTMQWYVEDIKNNGVWE